LINSERLFDRLQALGEIGKTEQGGVTRFSFTTEDRDAKRLVSTFMKEAGLEIREDNAGNLIGKMEGEDSLAPAVIIGSHIDTVKQGGKYDGALGVLAGIEVAQTICEQAIKLTNTLEIIAFADEEGSRFNFGMIGSRAIAGVLDKNELSRQDVDGISIEQAMREVGLDPDKIDEVKRSPTSIKHYLELHIEQGKVLEHHDVPVGIVSGIAGPLWKSIRIIGESGHAGATPMNMRKDPVIAFAELASKIELEVSKYPDTVATIGKVIVEPGGVNVIPKEVEFTIDLRSIDENLRNKIEAAITTYTEEICEKHELEFYMSTLQRIEPVPCSKGIQQAIKESSQAIDLKTIPLLSGAGHDAMQFKKVCPIGMIFVRSRDGISHNPAEFSSAADCADGANLLYQTVLRSAQ